jgi:hypothetical protein
MTRNVFKSSAKRKNSKKYVLAHKFKLIYDRQSVGQCVLVPGTHLGPVTNFFSLLEIFFRQLWVYFVVPSLTRGLVCNLQCNRWLVRSLRTNNHTLPSHLRLCSLFVVSYGSQGLRWRYSNPPPHGEEWDISIIWYIEIQFVPHRNHITSPLHSQPGHWGPITTLYRLIWDCIPYSSPLTTLRDCGGGILTRLHVIRAVEQ